MNEIYNEDSLKKLDDINREFDCIYIDPPFNSGRDYFMSPEDKKGFGDKWNSDLEYEKFIDSLVEKSCKVLKKNGSLFFHISAQEMYIPYKVCLNHFSHIQPIFWKKSRSKNNVKNKLGTAIDVIFWCHQTKNRKFNMIYQKLNEKYLNGSFNNKDERGNYSLGHLVSDPTRKGTYNYSVTIGEKTYNPERGWRIKEEDLRKLIDDNRIHVPRGQKANLYKKIYLHESKGKAAMDLWDDIHSIAQGSEKRLYPTAKPLELLKRIIEMTTDEGDWVLDPVAGSGTTGIAAKMMNRNFVLIDKNPESIKTINERISELDKKGSQ